MLQIDLYFLSDHDCKLSVNFENSQKFLNFLWVYIGIFHPFYRRVFIQKHFGPETEINDYLIFTYRLWNLLKNSVQYFEMSIHGCRQTGCICIWSVSVNILH